MRPEQNLFLTTQMKVAADLNNLAKIHDFGYNYNQNHSKVDREKLFPSLLQFWQQLAKKPLSGNYLNCIYFL